MLTVAQHNGPVDIRTPGNVTGKASVKAGDGGEDGDEEEQEDDEDEVEAVPEPEPATEPPSKKRRLADIDDEPASNVRPNPLGSTMPLRPATVSPSPSLSSSRAPSVDSDHRPNPPSHPKSYPFRAPFPPQGVRTAPSISGSGSRDAYDTGAGGSGGQGRPSTHHADSRRGAYPESPSDAPHPRYHSQGYPYPARMLYHSLDAFGRATPAPAPSHSHSYPHPYTHPYAYNDAPSPHPHPHLQGYHAHTHPHHPGSSDGHGASVADFLAAILGEDSGGHAHAGLKQEDAAGAFDWPVHNQNRSHNHESAHRPTATATGER